jgi:hypothetical protein
VGDTASRHLKQARLIKDRDYAVRAKDGAWVFSREYLLARGTCCESKCLNCPYANSRENLDRSVMRPIVSMVPSWTETLIAARLNVVARTRFCIHPEESVHDIPSLGGTKTLIGSAAEVMKQICSSSRPLRPLVVLDREENPKDFFDFFARFDCEIVVSHVSDFSSLASDLRRISQALNGNSIWDTEGAARLVSYADRTITLGLPMGSLGSSFVVGREPLKALDEALAEGGRATFYLIWKSPWMAVSTETWIGNVLRTLFPKINLPTAQVSKYPTLEPSDIAHGSNLLFSSEPFPFLREWESLKELPFVKAAKTAAIVDGELLSWFGIRAIRFLEEANSQVDSSTSVGS